MLGVENIKNSFSRCNFFFDFSRFLEILDILDMLSIQHSQHVDELLDVSSANAGW